MKGNGFWAIPVALVAGCVTLPPSLEHITPRALRVGAPAPPPAADEITARVRQRSHALPESMEGKEVEFGAAGPMEISRVAGRLSEALGVEVIIEVRGDGSEERIAHDEAAASLTISGKRRVGEVLAEMALRSDYDWEWEEGAEPQSGRLILYRDLLGPRSEDPAGGWGSKEEWRIDPLRHGTLHGVLKEWTARAGWTLVWEADDVDYAVRAPAIYLGTFEAAVDALLRETKGRRMLVPTLWRVNRYLTVREAG